MNNPDQAFEVREKLASLENALLEKTSNMPTLLRDIHRNLKKDPDLVTLLSEEEISVLVRGLKEQTKTELSVTLVKKKTKAASKMTLADL